MSINVSDFVYGGIDGTITTLAIIAASSGLSLETKMVVSLGLANILADGFSMGISRYLSAEEEDINALTGGLVTFISFIVVGLIPLLVFIYYSMNNIKICDKNCYNISYMMTGLALFMVGFVKGEILNKGRLKTGIFTTIIGGIAALIAYYVGTVYEIL